MDGAEPPLTSDNSNVAMARYDVHRDWRMLELAARFRYSARAEELRRGPRCSKVVGANKPDTAHAWPFASGLQAYCRYVCFAPADVAGGLDF